MPHRFRSVILGPGIAALLAVGLVAAPAWSADPDVDLATGADLRVYGATAFDESGSSVAGAGDVNGDGFDDMIVGARNADFNGRTNSGGAYVIFGSANTDAVDLASLGGRGFRIDGATASTNVGSAVAGAGDVNGDGFDDVLLGVAKATNNGRLGSGSSYVVYGSQNPAALDLASLGSRGFRIDGAVADDKSGTAVAGGGDINGDGRDDIIIGAPGASNNSRDTSGSTFVVYGDSSPTNVDLAALGAGGFRVDGAALGDASGLAVAQAGDINTDGYTDVAIGSIYASNNARTYSGSTYLVYGAAAGATVDLASLGSKGFRVDGAGANNQSGWSVAGAGDTNGDGRDDLVIGAISAGNNGRTGSGSGYVVYGRSAPTNVDLIALGNRGFRIDGAVAGDTLGVSVAGAGDLNGDGLDEILLGATTADNNGRVDSGSTFVVVGDANRGQVDLATTADSHFRIDGAAADDLSGRSVSGAGDLNGDGADDVIIGVRAADNNRRNDSGTTYAVFGTRPATPPVTPPVTPQDPPVTTAATLQVKARKAGASLPRTGKTKVVRAVTVGTGETASIRVKVLPKRARSSVKATSTARTVTIRTKKAAKGTRVRVKITAIGPGRSPVAFTRTWRIT